MEVSQGPHILWGCRGGSVLPLPAAGGPRCLWACGCISSISVSSHSLAVCVCVRVSPFM